jgi:hypothetical protein
VTRFVRWSRSSIERKTQTTALLLVKPTPRNVNRGSDRFAMFNKERDIPIFSSSCPLFWLQAEGRYRHRLPAITRVGMRAGSVRWWQCVNTPLRTAL